MGQIRGPLAAGPSCITFSWDWFSPLHREFVPVPLPYKGFRVRCSGADRFYSLIDSFLLKHNTFIQIFRDTFNKLAFGNAIHKPKLDVLSRVSSMTKTEFPGLTSSLRNTQSAAWKEALAIWRPHEYEILSVSPILALGCSSEFSMWGKCDSQLQKLCLVFRALRDSLMLYFQMEIMTIYLGALRLEHLLRKL